MTTIKPDQSYLSLVRPKTGPPGDSGKSGMIEEASRGSGFDRETSGIHQIYQTAQAERAARLQKIKLQVQNGTYRPNLDIVAERMLSEMGI